ncbi:hypothetical protein OZX74_00940 [Bifidobacterium sp. ESL0798]|uniref:hypothetical protein n=1 Tax=Bifidobacterium sp. ESL0798 TaxID=2983235 RepID=UPI0023F705F0|nr:hypothetical protein [Bifidobacterium sp. ESL0798]WEV74164.1 hypothetical protein OZX74_00940 [Bifidobacterium sp. ESL0798]
MFLTDTIDQVSCCTCRKDQQRYNGKRNHSQWAGFGAIPRGRHDVGEPTGQGSRADINQADQRKGQNQGHGVFGHHWRRRGETRYSSVAMGKVILAAGSWMVGESLHIDGDLFAITITGDLRLP